jgi:hypothetical protein
MHFYQSIQIQHQNHHLTIISQYIFHNYHLHCLKLFIFAICLDFTSKKIASINILFFHLIFICLLINHYISVEELIFMQKLNLVLIGVEILVPFIFISHFSIISLFVTTFILNYR